ncbi:MAG: hypothetical protein ABI395_07595 [Sphingobium sp.]
MFAAKGQHNPLTLPCYAARMIGIRYSSLFKSRWMALFWAAGILYSAYSFVAPDPDSDGPGGTAGADNQNMAVIANAM